MSDSKNPQNPEKNPELESDDEPMDPETLKALKNNSINSEILAADFNKEKKVKETKKSKKNNTTKKGQDFLNFAKENGIDLNLKYEDKEEAKKSFYKDGSQPYKGKYNTNKPNDQENNNNFEPHTFKNSNINRFQKKPYHFQNKTKNNKFDQANNMMLNNPLMLNQMRPQMINNPYQMQYAGMNPQNNQQRFNQMNYAPHIDMNIQDPLFAEDKTLEEVLINLFSVDYLNKEVYLRKRISDDGLIELGQVLNYNKLKTRNVTVDQIKEISENLKNTNLELCEIEGKTYIKLNEWEVIQGHLLTVDQIQTQKRALKNQKYSNMNYVGMQNNYFFPQNNGQQFHYGSNQMPGVLQPMMEQYQGNPYVMGHMPHQMGQINMNYQQNYIQNMNQQYPQTHVEQGMENLNLNSNPEAQN